jgi:hypothetical protein
LNRVSKVATFDAVSDIFETDVSSGFWPYKNGAKDTELVGVEAAVGIVLLDDISFFFFKTLRAVLRKVDMESLSLLNPNDIPSVAGTSKRTELVAVP